MKPLIILSHPNIADSKINQSWANGIAESNIDATVHHINAKYPDGKIDVEAEQRLILEHDALVLQFPFYWFNVPPLLKQWLDDILVPGFAYGPTSEERKLTGMPIGIAVSTGIKGQDYTNQGRYKYTVKELLAPLHASASYIGAKALDPYIFYGAEYNPTQEEIKESSTGYLEYLRALSQSKVADFAA